MRKDAPLAIEVPSADRDSPGWVKVGVIAAVGFVIGVGWPRIMGVRLGPSAPGEAAAMASASAAKAGARAPEAPPATVVAKTPVAPAGSASAVPVAAAPSASAAVATPTALGAPQISVQKGSVLSCKTTDGDAKKGKECGPVAGLDQLVAPRLRKLSTCSAAEGQTGKLSFVVTADFAGGKMNWDIGKSSNVGNIDGIGTCLRTIFQGTSVSGVSHEHARYTVSYSAMFASAQDSASAKDKGEDRLSARDKADKNAKDDPRDEKESGKPEPPPVAGGEANVGWEVALVRDVPKTGQVVARLPRGTKVKVGSAKDGWFAIKFGDGFASDGWVYRGAINR